jgi:hypothetical protein
VTGKTLFNRCDRDFQDVTSADQLFVSLDGSIVDAGFRAWLIEICGIHSEGSRHWIQLNLHADESDSVTLCVDRLDAAKVRSLLVDWLSGKTLSRSVAPLTAARAHA